MASTATEEKKSASDASSPKVESPQLHVKSYWYPDRVADLKEVNVGYKAWRSKERFVSLSLIPIMLTFLAIVVYQGSDYLKYFAYLEAEIRKNSRSIRFLLKVLIANSEKDFWLSFSMFMVGSVVLIAMVTVYFMKKAVPVYLLDFTTYQPPDELKVPHSRFMSQTINSNFFDAESIDFQEKLLYRTGLGNETYFPPGVLSLPPKLTMADARKEAEMVLGACLDALFERTGLKPTDIDILIVNCSLFNPTPSLAAMMINKYKMRTDIKNYNLSGMGCSAGVISIDLAKDLLQVHKNCFAVVLSTENITQNWYPGNQKSKLISNTLFRMGGAAILLTNKWWYQWNAKYQLHCTVRVHKGASEKAYRAVYQEEDDNGHKGVNLSKELMEVAGDALKSNLTILGPLVLPWSEQIKFFYINFIHRRIEKMLGKQKITPNYVPDFKKAFQHFCIHAGGRAIIDGLEENLKLEPHHVEPSRATLYRYGNTSSSSIWYELQFIELSGRIKKGDKVFQIALGSGFKCNSAVWKRLV